MMYLGLRMDLMRSSGHHIEVGLWRLEMVDMTRSCVELYGGFERTSLL